MLLLQELRTSEPVELGRIMRNVEVELGREPSAHGIPIANEAVSRVHGRISSISNYWIYQDLESTNGSWINGEPVLAGSIGFLHSGDTLQLASSLIQVTELSSDGRALVSSSPNSSKRSLLVLLGDVFIGEYPVPEYGRALVIGGPSADLQVEGMMLNNPSLVIERKGMYTTAASGSSEVAAYLNNEPLGKPVTIKNGDQITRARYRVIYNEPLLPKDAGEGSLSDAGNWNSLARRNSTETDQPRDDYSGGFLNKPAHGALFGKPHENYQNEGRIAQDTVRMQPLLRPQTFGRDSHPAMRNPGVKSAGSFDSLEERIVVVVGIALLFTLIVLLILWVAV